MRRLLVFLWLNPSQPFLDWAAQFFELAQNNTLAKASAATITNTK
jgi:hypothetical protein